MPPTHVGSLKKAWLVFNKHHCPQRQKSDRSFSQLNAAQLSGLLRFRKTNSSHPNPSIPSLSTPLPPLRYNVLASRPDIAGSAAPRCSARFCSFCRCPEDRHNECGFGAGRQELHPPGEWRADRQLRCFTDPPPPIPDRRRFFWSLRCYRGSASLRVTNADCTAIVRR